MSQDQNNTARAGERVEWKANHAEQWKPEGTKVPRTDAVLATMYRFPGWNRVMEDIQDFPFTSQYGHLDHGMALGVVTNYAKQAAKMVADLGVEIVTLRKEKLDLLDLVAELRFKIQQAELNQTARELTQAVVAVERRTQEEKKAKAAAKARKPGRPKTNRG